MGGSGTVAGRRGEAVPSVGRQDLEPPLPFMPGPGGAGQPPLGPYGPGAPGGGSFVGEYRMITNDRHVARSWILTLSVWCLGPDHPIFGGEVFPGAPVPGWGPAGPGSGAGMQPRYDPIHPVPGGAPMGGRNFGGRGLGRGRGSAAPRVPGEPGPDHLNPPNFDDNDDMYS